MNSSKDPAHDSIDSTMDLSSLSAALGIDLSSFSNQTGINLAAPNASLPIGWVRVPDAISYPENIDHIAFANLPVLLPDQLCDYCHSIPFDVLGFHRRIRTEDFDGKFPADREFVQVLMSTKTCFFCQKIALLFQSWKQQESPANIQAWMCHHQHEASLVA